MTDPVQEKHESLAEALSAFQAEVPTFQKDKTANIGQYSYKYVDLGDILPVVNPLLAKHGMSWSSKPGRDAEGEMVLHFTLRHGKETDEGEVPLGVPKNCKPQQLGSAMTYLRRYAMVAHLNIPTDDDDDAQAALAAARGETPPSGPAVASESERSQILAAAAEMKMPSSLLAKTLLLATGKDELLAEIGDRLEDNAKANSWVTRYLRERLLAEDVPQVIAAIEAPE